jgi:hypothetical protein
MSASPVLVGALAAAQTAALTAALLALATTTAGLAGHGTSWSPPGSRREPTP